jgi:hypothetical protein
VSAARLWHPPAGLRLEGPVALGEQRLPAGSFGSYVVSVGPVVAAIGAGGSRTGAFASRVRSLAVLGNHRASRRVLCAAFCQQAPPLLWWRLAERNGELTLESELKSVIGDPAKTLPACHRAEPLKRALVEAAGEDTWEAGYVEAVLEIGERLELLFQPRLADLWRTVGIPPGPWARRYAAGDVQ